MAVWDTLKLVPPGTLTAPPGLEETPATPSFVHLHLGIDATGLPKDLDCHHTVINHWDKIDDPQNMAIISIPTTLDPSMAPPGRRPQRQEEGGGGEDASGSCGGTVK
jgi:phytoene dehydrogenase-like protein